MWDISDLVSEVTWKTSRFGKPSTLDVTFVKRGLFQSRSFDVQPGDIIDLKMDGRNLFLGYVFTVDRGQDEELKITAYDQIRYLMMNETYLFKNVTATEVIRRIAGDFGLKVGNLADTGYRIPLMMEENQKLLDIICKVLDRTLIATGKIYLFYDDYGQLTVRPIEEMTLDLILGEKSLMTGYQYQQSIDSETYNQVKIVRDNKASGRREAFIYKDSDNIAKWGLLQWYEKVDERLNEAQIKERLQNMLDLKNREQRTLRLDAIGDIRVRAGCFVHVLLEEWDALQKFLVNECTHKFSGGEHTMSLELKVI